MYGRINQPKITEQDYMISCQQTRLELQNYIDKQSRRVNIDSAKKKAVIQHMDYQGFRQMVLAANIFPTKSKQLYNFSKGESPPSMPLNKQIHESKGKQEQQLSSTKNYPIDCIQKIQGKSEYHCFNFREFKKKFKQNYQKQLNQSQAQECYRLIKQQNKQRIQIIFNIQCEPNILINIGNVFEFILDYLLETKSDIVANQTIFMSKFFQAVVSISTMKQYSIEILTKKQRTLIISVLNKIKNTLIKTLNEENLCNIDQTIDCFSH